MPVERPSARLRLQTRSLPSATSLARVASSSHRRLITTWFQVSRARGKTFLGIARTMCLHNVTK